MAIPGSAFSTYDVGWPYSTANPTSIGTREDAQNTLTMIDPDEAMTLAVLAKTTTNGLRHEWFIDTLQATSTAAALMGEDWAGMNNSTAAAKVLKKRTRLWNFVQFFRQDYSILLDELKLSQGGQIFGVGDELSYQNGKAGQEVNRNVDARMWSLGSSAADSLYAPVSGGDLTAPRLGNFKYWAHTSGITASSGAAGSVFTTAGFYAIQEAMWMAGAKPETLFVSPGVKSDISRVLLGDTAYPTAQGGSQGIPAVAGAGVVSGGEYGPVIDFIRTDFGRVAQVVDRWIPQQTAVATAASAEQYMNAGYFLAERAKLRVAWWRPITPYQVASLGDNVKMYVIGACTTEVLHPSCLGTVAGIIT